MLRRVFMQESGIVPEMIFAPMTIIYGELHSSCLVEVPDKLRWSDVGSGQSPMLSLWAHVELTGCWACWQKGDLATWALLAARHVA